MSEAGPEITAYLDQSVLKSQQTKKYKIKMLTEIKGIALRLIHIHISTHTNLSPFPPHYGPVKVLQLLLCSETAF